MRVLPDVPVFQVTVALLVAVSTSCSPGQSVPPPLTLTAGAGL